MRIILILLAVCTLAACEKAVDFWDDQNSSHFFKANVDGETMEWGSKVNGSGTSSFTEVDTMPESKCAITYAANFTNIQGLQSFQLIFNHHFEGYCSDELIVFHDLFKTGNIEHLTEGKGFSIHWRDDRGVIWDSSLGVQTNSFLEVVELEDENDNAEFGTYRKELKGNFKCILYNAIGDLKVIENGEFFMYFDSAN